MLHGGRACSTESERQKQAKNDADTAGLVHSKDDAENSELEAKGS